MHWRKSQPALLWGDIRFLETVEPVLAFTRSFSGDTVLVVFNLADQAVDATLPALDKSHRLNGHGLAQGNVDGNQLHLPGYGAWFAKLD
jgi:alpha-glucosidase